MWQDAPYPLDAEHTTPSRAAVDDLELEPTRRLGDDQGLGRRESTELASPAIEEAPPDGTRLAALPVSVLLVR
jgi:hypothetical protein